MENLQEKMIQYRAKHRMNQTEFAKKAGLSVQTICSVETGQQSPSKTTIAKINMAMEEREE